MVRSEKEIRDCIKSVEACYPEGKTIHPQDSVGQYNLGLLAGLNVALGVYSTFAEIDLEHFMRTTFNGEIYND